MTVNEAIKLLAYGTAYEIKGAYSGKIYRGKNLDKYANREVTDEPFYTDVRIRGSENNHWCIPVIGIWMNDYDLAESEDKE